MQVSVESLSGLERKLTIVVPSERIQGAVDKKIQEATKTVSLNGFRAGKVPARVIHQRYGDSILNEVLGEAIQESYYGAIQQEDLNPVSEPEIDAGTVELGKDVEFTAVIEVFPEVKLNDFSGLEVENPVSELSQEDQDELIENLRKQKAEWIEVDRVAAEGDQLKIDFDGAIDGDSFEGGKGEGVDLELGSNSMIDGFETGLIGAKAGEEKALDLTFPEDYKSEELAGKAAVFTVKVHQVNESKLPELDEEFIKEFGFEDKSVEEFKDTVKTNMTRELENAVISQKKKSAFEQLIEKNEVEVPKALVDREVAQYGQQFSAQMGGGNEMPEILETLMSGYRETAERRLKLSLLVSEIVREHGIEADATRVRQKIEETAAAYPEPQQVVEWYYNNDKELASIESAILEELVVEKMLESAKVVDKTYNYKDLMTQSAGNESF
ncbi:MAG: trigger factor [Pseudomonadales bacterium]|nr:trigger factor [Pseudomonadales bacterium]